MSRSAAKGLKNLEDLKSLKAWGARERKFFAGGAGSD
jgi:hypothetical protein